MAQKKSQIIRKNAGYSRRAKNGALTRKAETMLEMLQDDFHFQPVKEFIEVYAKENQLYQELFSKMQDPRKRGRLNKEDRKLFLHLSKELKIALETIFRYSFPTLRSVDVKGDFGKVPIFNITIGEPPAIKVKEENSNNVINIVPKPAPLPPGGLD